MATKTTSKLILPGIGTDQDQRIVDALDPQKLKLLNFGVPDWMKFAWQFAEKINYFNSDNQEAGNWQDFFIEEAKIKSFIDTLETDQSLTPHLTLFVCFLKLLDNSRDHFNLLSKRHLDFYYQKILKIEKQAAVPDQVHLIFELAKNVLQAKIDQHTALEAGKDSAGKKLIFNTEEELVPNKITIAQLKNVYHHTKDKDIDFNAIKACEVANSLDGKGKALPESDAKWYPFGYVKSTYSDENPELPNASLGFAIASSLLLLKEGTRTIDMKLQFQNSLPANLDELAIKCISVYFSGQKKWLGPFSLIPTTATSASELIFKLELDKKTEAVSAYNQAVLGEHFSTADPVLRFLIDTGTADGYAFATAFSANSLKSATLKVDVKEMTAIGIENDLGILNAKKPFMPFGSIPVKGSNFTVRNEEILKKDWTSLHLNVNWMNTPDSFRSQYFAYREDFRSETTSKRYKERILIDTKDASGFKQDSANMIVKNDDYFKVSVNVFSANEWVLADESKAEEVLFIAEDGSYKSQFTVTNSNQKFDTGENGGLRLTLKNSFLHEMYPRIYAMAMMDETKTALIPKEPYTPLVEMLTVGYAAETTAVFDTNESFSSRQISLFHEHPFGQSHEHAFLKPKPLFAATPVVTLVPDYQPGGELYLGLKDAEPLQQLAVLFQIFEGSENPLAIGFEEGEKMEWSVLCSNSWKVLDSNHLITNVTDNFLKSGIVKFSIPAEATKNNTLLAPNLTWVKVRMNKKFDAVCKIISIIPQAAVAKFTNNGNELSHLKNGLQAKTISKLVERKQEIKTVSQPFNSFGGKPEETDDAYYRRISERLRHKNRAITLWDYEHLILQEFPEIHKVRCLNHTLGNSYLSPGNVTIVVIPDIQNRNVFDLYEPRVSKATLNKIQDYISQLNSLHINAVVINPEYEPVEISLKVRFHAGFDENYYKKVLQEDITKLLSPWAFERNIDLNFGTELHKSIVISYIEKLNYVDYIAELKMKHNGEFKPAVAPSGPKSILVSAKEHPVDIQPAVCPK